MHKVVIGIVSAAIAIPLIAIIFLLPSWFLGGHKQVQEMLVTAFLTFDGIMVAATAFFLPLKTKFFGRTVLIISTEFVVASAGFLLSFRGIIGTSSTMIHAGTAMTIGLVLMFAGLVSLLVLLVGTYLALTFQKSEDDAEETEY